MNKIGRPPKADSTRFCGIRFPEDMLITIDHLCEKINSSTGECLNRSVFIRSAVIEKIKKYDSVDSKCGESPNDTA